MAGARDLSISTLLDRRVREDWEADGARDAYAVALERALEILESHHPEPLDADVAAQMSRIVQAADERRA